MGNENKTSVKDCRIIQLPKFEDRRGNLSFIEEGTHLSFPIARVYWTYDVPGGQKRVGHAYCQLEEFIVAISGSFNIIVDDGTDTKTFQLNRSYYGLYIPRMVWRTLDNFSTNSLGMILASRHYEEEDYLRKYEYFQEMK